MEKKNALAFVISFDLGFISLSEFIHPTAATELLTEIQEIKFNSVK